MKELNGKGLAIQPASELCAGSDDVLGDVLTEAHADRVLSSEITYLPTAERQRVYQLPVQRGCLVACDSFATNLQAHTALSIRQN